MFLFRALGRLISTIMYVLSAGTLDLTDTLSRNSKVVDARYQSIIHDKISQIHRYRSAVATLIAQEETKKEKLSTLRASIKECKEVADGAEAITRQIVTKFKAAGKSEADIEANHDYQECVANYNDASTTLKTQQEEIESLMTDLENLAKTIGDHKIQMQQLMRDLDKLKTERAEAVAEFISTKEEKEIADMLSGLQQDGTAGELQRLRDLRKQVRAEARIAKETSGMDVTVQRERFKQAARTMVATDEFRLKVGLGGDTVSEKPRAEVKAEERLPT